jgi:predicted membrane-bound spermidine synthase
MIMSDTPAEVADHRELIHVASGSVLLNGLGLGVAARLILAKPVVTDVTIIELSPDVIKLVSPHISDPRLTIIEADAFTWQPPRGKRFNAVWHDIWDDICSDNLPGMHKLHRRYGRRADWQGSWCRELCEFYLQRY